MKILKICGASLALATIGNEGIEGFCIAVRDFWITGLGYLSKYLSQIPRRALIIELKK